MRCFCQFVGLQINLGTLHYQAHKKLDCYTLQTYRYAASDKNDGSLQILVMQVGHK